MRLSKLLIVFALFLLFLNLLNLPPARAQTLWEHQVGMGGDTGGTGEIGEAFGQTGAPQDIRAVVARMINVFLSFLGVTFLILLLWGGFKWMTAGGNEENVKTAQRIIRDSIIGLIIIFMSWGIASFVTDCLLDVTNGPTAWMCTD